MKTWKKNLIATAVLLTVCGGIYVNWLYTENQTTANLTDILDAEKVISTDAGIAGENTDSLTTVTDYFAAVRLSRQEARDSAVGLLQEAMSYNDNAEAAQSNTQLETIVNTALCEAQIESLVIAKGYTDCVAYISDNGISVAVASPEGGLQTDDVAVIADIVMTQSEYVMDDIHVIEVQ